MAKGVIMAGGGGTGSDECTAARADVLKGKTAVTSDSNDEAVSGTLELTGDAADSHVLSGKTYYNTDAKAKRTGTMTNQGAKTSSLNCGGSYTIPAGYHNGSGKVTANSLSSQTGVDSGKTAAAAAQILTGYQAWVNGSKVTGSMANQGAKTSALNCGGSYTIPAGYHNGSGKVTANSLASQTAATAVAAHIISGETAWVNGKKITGTLAVQSAISFSAAAMSYDTIRISWKNPAKGPWQGIFIQMSTSGSPGMGGGTRVYTGAGVNGSIAGGSNYVDITGLDPNTTYYFTCTSYCTNLGNGTSYNVSAATQKRSVAQILSRYGEDITYRIIVSNEANAAGYTRVANAALAENQFTLSTRFGGSSNAGFSKNTIMIVQDSTTRLTESELNELKGFSIRITNSKGTTVHMDYGKITSISWGSYTAPSGTTRYGFKCVCTNSPAEYSPSIGAKVEFY